MKLNQVIALVQGKKARATKVLTEAHRGWKPDALMGLTKTYQPSDEDGDQQPAQHKEVPVLLWDVVERLKRNLGPYYDVVGTQEGANQRAEANVVVDGKVLLEQVPVTVLLFLDKQITDLLVFAKNLPVLPMDRHWFYDTAKNCYVTATEKTTRTQKVPEVVVKYDATPEHPAQTEIFSVDRTVGHWNTMYMSGCIPAKKKEEIVNRLEKLQDAVKSAREEANNTDVQGIEQYGETVLDYIFGQEGSLTS